MLFRCQKIFICFGFLLFGSAEKVFAGYEQMTFQDAYEQDEQFQSRNFSRVLSLRSNEEGWLDRHPEQQEAFLSSSAFRNLCDLDVRNQNIDDKFTEALCRNPSFARLSSLNLTGNPAITFQSLKYILDSDSLGSLREAPQISGRHGKTSSEIRVVVTGTTISAAQANEWNEKYRTPFPIRYQRIADDEMVFLPARGIKILLVERREEVLREPITSGPTGPTGAAFPFPYMVVPGPTGPVAYVPVSSWPGNSGPTGPAQPF